MTLEQLEYALAVESNGTVSAAAQALNISHPAISRAISNLEDELGVNIFTRSRLGMEVTPDGKLVLESARRIYAEINHLYEQIGQKPERQMISVAVFPIDALFFLPDVITAFRSNCDYARVSLQHMEISEVMGKVRASQVTFGICTLAKGAMAAVSDEFAVIPLFKSSYAIGYSSALLRPTKDFITTEEVRRYPLILHDDSAIVSALTDVFGDLSTLNILMFSNDNTLIKQMVAEGHALSIHTMFLDKSDSKAAGGIQLIPLRNQPIEEVSENEMEIECVLFYKKKKRLNQAERLFVQALKRRTEEWR